jgi:hypothetical protein
MPAPPQSKETSMTRLRSPIAAAALALIACSALAAEDAPYGTSHFESYADIGTIKQMKAVWDFNFVDPKAVGFVFNNVNALLKATADFGPNEIEPLKVVIVSHGPEVVLWAKKNYGKYKELVDRAASLAKQGVRFEVCRNAAGAQGFKPEDLHGFVTVVPAGPYALAYWQAKGYALNAVGATMPTPPIDDLNRADIAPK